MRLKLELSGTIAAYCSYLFAGYPFYSQHWQLYLCLFMQTQLQLCNYGPLKVNIALTHIILLKQVTNVRVVSMAKCESDW